MKTIKQLLSMGLTAYAVVLAAPAQASIIVNQTADSATLGNALQGSGLTITSANVVNGANTQFGTYSNFTAPPVTFGNGIVLSSGNAVDTAGPSSADDLPSTEVGSGSTTEFNNYGSGHITNFNGAYDVAALKVDFTLASDSAVSFDFIFGSVEFPNFVNKYADAFLTFLDGTAVSDQVVYDSNGNPVQVGSSFQSSLTTADTNTAFGGGTHGLITSLTTTTNVLGAGDHTLWFELGDVNDQQLDSAVFLSNLRASTGGSGTTPSVPEPGSLALMGLGLVGVALARKRRVS